MNSLGANVMSALSGYAAVKTLGSEDPCWLPVVRECYRWTTTNGERFARSWIVQNTGQWFPNLKPLVSRGILEKLSTTRGGSRAYYRLIDPNGVARALTELQQR
jgi:hypothetical protein